MGGTTFKHKFLFTGEERDLKRSLKAVEKSMAKVDKAYAAIGTGAGVLGLKTIGADLSRFVTGTAKDLDELAKRSRALNMPSEELDAWEYAAERSGVTTEQMGVALRTVAKQVYDAARGTGEGKLAFDELGVSVTDNEGRMRGLTATLMDISDGMEDVADKDRRAALAQKMFGESGTALVNMLGDGSGAIKDLLVDAHTLGTRYDAVTAKGEEFEDQQTRLNRSLRTVQDVVVGAALPSLTALSEMLAGKVMTATTGLSEEYRRFLGELRVAPAETALQMAADKEAELRGELELTNAAMADAKKNYRGIREQRGMGIRSIGEATGPQREYLNQMAEEQSRAKDLQRELEALAKEKELIQKRIDGIRQAQEQWEKGMLSAKSTMGVLSAEQREANAIMAKSRTPVEVYRDTLHGLQEHLEKGRISQEAYDRSVISATEALNNANPAYQKHLQLIRDGEALYEETLTPIEEYSREVGRLVGLLDAGAISQETYNRAVRQAINELNDAKAEAARASDEADGAMSAAGSAGVALVRGVGGVISEIATTARGELKDIAEYADQVADQVLSALIQTGLIDPLVKGVVSLATPSTPVDMSPAPGTIGPPNPFLDKSSSTPSGSSGSSVALKSVPAAQIAGGGDSLTIQFLIQALDTQSAVEVITSQKAAILGMMQEAYNKLGMRGPLG